MNTHSLNQTNPFWKRFALLKLLESLPTVFSGTSAPLQENLSDQGQSSTIQSTHSPANLQPTYYLERRWFL